MVLSAFAKPPAVTVLYPEVREPYREVFLEIIKGIENRLNEPINTYVLDKDYDMAALKVRLTSARTQVVIALGSRGLLAARALASDFKVVAGAVLINPSSENITGISLIPDPKILFQRLKQVVPEVKRITVIYSQAQNGWLIEKARTSARAQNLAFNAFPVSDIHQAAALYRDVLRSLHRDIDAIWLPQDEMLDEQAILPLVLQMAWDRSLVTFSSNLAYLKRGVLFALYPDNEGMGRRLAELTLRLSRDQGNVPGEMELLRDLFSAVNFRAAEHLGLKFTAQQRRAFDLVLPVQ